MVTVGRVDAIGIGECDSASSAKKFDQSSVVESLWEEAELMT